MILDTTVLIDLQRELRREEAGPASRLLEELRDTEAAITFVTWMEFAEGYGEERREACHRFLAPFQVLYDVEGKRYIDYCLSWGPMILGHARQEIL